MAKQAIPRKGHGGIRLLFFLMLVAALLIHWPGGGRCESGMPSMNASGNLNRTPAVDPIGETEGYSAILYDNKSGMPTSEANAIAQTGEGFLWVGSYAGLIRYDGRSFERFETDEALTNVRCLFVDSQDRLWVGTNDAGVFCLSKGEVRHWDKTGGLESLSVRSITEAENGKICIAGTMGVGLIDAAFRYETVKDERLFEQTIEEVRRGNDGTVYGVTNTGDLFAMKEGKLISFYKNSSMPFGNIFSVLPDPEEPGSVYISTERHVCHGRLGQDFDDWRAWAITPLQGADHLEWINGRIWICARSGIGVLEDGKTRLLQRIPMTNSFSQVMTDSEGNLWIASGRQGVMKIVPNRFTNVFEQCGIPTEVVNSTCLSDGRLFVGTDSGLIVLEDGKKLESLPLTEAVTAAGAAIRTTDLLTFLKDIRIRSIIRDSAGRLWISTARVRGLLRYDGGKLTQFTERDGLLSETIRVVSECRDGAMLVATNNGINVIRGDRVTESYGQREGLTVRLILTILEGDDGSIVAGTDGDGIYVIGPDGLKRIGAEEGLTSDIILRIRRSRARDLYWIVTGNSLACMTPDYRVKTIQGFPYANNCDLYESNRGDLWLLGSSGVYVIPAEMLEEGGTVEPLFFGMASGLPYTATANSYSELTPEGELFISGNEGVVKVDLEKRRGISGETKIALPYLDADGTRLYPDADGSFTLPGNTRKLTFFPYVLSYSLTNPQVSYQLEGFDPEEVTLNRSDMAPVYYTNLANGTYHFVLRVKDPVMQTDHETSFRIIKGKASTVGNAGSIIMDIASLFFMGGLLVYTDLYRKRGRLDDRLFFAMILINMILAVADALTYLMEGSGYTGTRSVMIAGNLVFFTAFEIFPYLYLLYLDYRISRSKEQARRKKLWFGIPCALILIPLLLNPLTGWFFSVNADGIYEPGPWNSLVFVPVIFYFAVSLFRVRKINVRLVWLGILLIVTRVAWGIWFRDISSTALTYTLFLVCAHIHVMNQPLTEESL